MSKTNKIHALLAVAVASGLSMAAHDASADAHLPGPYGADTPNQSAPPRTSEGLVYVNNVTVNEHVGHGQPLAVQVEGDLPDAAWKFLKLEVRRQGKTITIRALGTRNKSAIAIQVLRPFKAETTVAGLSPGKYQVVVQGRSKAITRTVRVT